MTIKGEIEKLIIFIVLIYKNDNYYELKFFIQIDNYCEPEGVTLNYNIILMLLML